MQIAINHMAYYLLTIELLDFMKQTSTSGRIVNVASHSHYGGKLNFDDLYMTKGYGGYKMYERTKLCNVLFTMELAERLKGTNVTVNALHPGVVKTDIGKKHGGLLYALGWELFAKFGVDTDKGAETSIYLASSPEVEGVSGKYWAKSKHKWHSRYSQTEGMKERLWAETEKLVK
jgi:NAD(P)-dependent dehydrogenase (short-subunit alcohol dehydrogenase family)